MSAAFKMHAVETAKSHSLWECTPDYLKRDKLDTFTPRIQREQEVKICMYTAIIPKLLCARVVNDRKQLASLKNKEPTAN